MADDTYTTKVYRERGGAALVFKSGARLEIAGVDVLTTGDRLNLGALGPAVQSFLESVTSSAAVLQNYGVSVVRSSGAVTIPLEAPVAGVQKWITVFSTAGNAVTITSSSNGADIGLGGSTQIAFSTGLLTLPTWVHLMGLNSTRWVPLAISPNVTIA